MKKRMWSACALAFALLLLLSSASLAKSSRSDSGSDQRFEARIGVHVVERPVSIHGDDDSPDNPKDGGDEGDDDPTGKGTIASAGGSTGMKDWWANFRLQLFTVLRVWK